MIPRNSVIADHRKFPDGVFPGKDSCVVVALAIDIHGHKHLLDFEEGSSESAEVVKGLFARLHARGLKAGTARRLLLVRDGSDAIAKAVRHFWPDAVQQECLVHVERGLCAKLSWKHQHEVVAPIDRCGNIASSHRKFPIASSPSQVPIASSREI